MARHTLLGVEVDAVTLEDLNRAIARAVEEGRRVVIANHNLHSAFLFHTDPKMRSFYQRADLIHIDGMPLVLWGRLVGLPLGPEHRVTYVDWVWPLMAEAERRGWRVFYLGGRPGVAERAAERLRQAFPGLSLATHHGYFGEEENAQVLERIRLYGPHVLMVGMGMPRQEHWVLDNWEALQVNAVLTAGACFDYIAGAIPTPPRWAGRVGLEWFFRLLAEPRRLWRRYLVEPWYLLPHAYRDVRRRVERGGG